MLERVQDEGRATEAQFLACGWVASLILAVTQQGHHPEVSTWIALDGLLRTEPI